jgi:predicted transcriptional regulator
MVKELNNWLKIYFEAVDNYKTNEVVWRSKTLELEVYTVNDIVTDIINDLNEIEDVLDGIIAYDENNITKEYMVNELSNWTKLYYKAIEE